MIVASLIAGVRARRNWHRRSRRVQAEIEGMSLRELADVCGDRTDVLDSAYFHVHGTLGSAAEVPRNAAATWAGRRRTP